MTYLIVDSSGGGDHTTIEAALSAVDALPLVSHPLMKAETRVVKVRPGIYSVSSLSIPDHCLLVGDGQWLTGGTKIFLTANTGSFITMREHSCIDSLQIYFDAGIIGGDVAGDFALFDMDYQGTAAASAAVKNIDVSLLAQFGDSSATGSVFKMHTTTAHQGTLEVEGFKISVLDLDTDQREDNRPIIDARLTLADLDASASAAGGDLFMKSSSFNPAGSLGFSRNFRLRSVSSRISDVSVGFFSSKNPPNQDSLWINSDVDSLSEILVHSNSLVKVT